MTEETEISPTEDLMREHGILNRIMLIYEDILQKIKNKTEFDINLLLKSATIVKEFIEEYHEPLEEKYIFSALLEKNMHTELIEELIAQHRISKLITEKIFKFIADSNLSKISKYIKIFIHMYRAHESREDTVIFTQFRKITDDPTIKKLADVFEDTEHELFGPGGYESILAKVTDIEKQLGIYDLKVYTPLIIYQFS